MKLLFNLLAVISFLLDNGKTFICYVFSPAVTLISMRYLRPLQGFNGQTKPEH